MWSQQTEAATARLKEQSRDAQREFKEAREGERKAQKDYMAVRKRLWKLQVRFWRPLLAGGSF